MEQNQALQENTHIPLPPAAPQALFDLINSSLWRIWHAEGRVAMVSHLPLDVKYLRYKNDASCRIVIEAKQTDQPSAQEVYYSVRIFRSKEEAEKYYTKQEQKLTRSGWPALHPDGRPILYLDKERAVCIQTYPWDSSLPNLRPFHDPNRLRRILFELLGDKFSEDDWRIKRRNLKATLLAYKPERRAVYDLAFELRSRSDKEVPHKQFRWHCKLESPLQSQQAHALHECLFDSLSASQEVCIAKPIGFSEDLGLRASEWLHARTLKELIFEDKLEDNSRIHSHLEKLGRALAELHQLPLDTKEYIGQIRHALSPIEEAMNIKQIAADYCALIPEFSEEIQNLAEKLAGKITALSSSTSSVIHGDLHTEQIMFSQESVYLIDLDQAALGYAMCDIGQLVASLRVLDLPRSLDESFLQAYQEKTMANYELLNICTALAIFKRISEPFRSLVPDWPTEFKRRLQLAAAESERPHK